jgi:hypothetical protein
MISVVIPAHNEARVLPRLLAALRPGIESAQLAVVVVANGCDDNTADVAREAGVTVVELSGGNKIRALDAGDVGSKDFPRFYIDGDVVVAADQINRMAARLRDGIEAVAPSLHLDGARSGWAVRSYHRYWAALPTVSHSLAGRGCFGLTEAGRSRWGRFPDVVADDQFVNQMFESHEIAVISTVTSTVTLPASLGALIARKRRSHRGNRELAETGATSATSRVQWLDVLRTNPRRVIDLPVFLAVTVLVRLAAWRDSHGGDTSWGADVTSRATP